MQSIVKAEILWTRACPLQCSYCAMADGRRNSVPFTLWLTGFTQLKKLGCSFAAFYGAEPLSDFDKLPETIEFAEELGIHTTVITSGIVSDLTRKLKELYEHGLRSITTSYDINSTDSDSQRKTNKALEVIRLFKENGPVRDSAVVVTLTRQNFRNLPHTIRTMSDKGIWTFFDLIHPDRGQVGAKVKDAEEDLLFRKEDWVPLIDVLKEVMRIKKAGGLCHTSSVFVETLKIVAAYMTTAPEYLPYSAYLVWNCARSKLFPSWVTVNPDGTVYPCDDFQPQDVTKIKIWEIYDQWSTFKNSWKNVTHSQCPGCLWNTHIDSHNVKEGSLPLSDYIHGIGEPK